MKPLSAAYYVRENKGRAFVIIFLLFLTTLMFLAGNYVNSVYYFWEKSNDYSDRMSVVSALSTDEDYKEFAEFYRDLKNDDKLIVQPRSPYGFAGLPWDCTLGFEMGSDSMVFNTPDDLRTAFGIFGISGDFSEVEDGTVCISTALAAQYGLKKGDFLDSSVREALQGKFRIADLTADDSYIVFYVVSSDESDPVRLNVLSTELSGQELRDHIDRIRAGRKAEISVPTRQMIGKQFKPFDLIFGAGMIILSLILAVIINSVITGQFISRTYEFGIYKAIGLSKSVIFRKIAGELLLMDAIAIAAGGIITILFTFLMNELVYIPAGKYLPCFSKMGLYAFLASNALVVVPTILLKTHSMSRSDVTQF